MERSAANAQPLVAISSYGNLGASTRVRLYDWIAHCELEDVEKHSYLGTANNQFSTLGRRAPEVLQAELSLRSLVSRVSSRQIVLSKQASPFSSGQLEQRLLSSAAHSVYDFDDALFQDTQGLLRKIWSKKKLWTGAVQAADVVIAGSPVLAEQAAGLSRNVVMIPSCVEPNQYVRKIDYSLPGTPRAVWIGSPATEKFLLGIADPLMALNRKYGLRLDVISAGSGSLGELDQMIDRIDWSEDSFAANLCRGDFGIMPLDDTPFTRGKCSYKLLQYAATGLPLIGSPVGANDNALSLLGGFKARGGRDWLEAAEAILNMGEVERSKLGADAFAGVDAHYSFRAWRDVWIRAVQPDAR